jgi:hypothetical protein
MLKHAFGKIFDSNFLKFFKYLFFLIILLSVFQAFTVLDYLFFILLLVFLFLLNLTYFSINEGLYNEILNTKNNFKENKRLFSKIKREARNINRILYLQISYILNSLLDIKFNKFKPRIHLLNIKPQFIYIYIFKINYFISYNKVLLNYILLFLNKNNKKKFNTNKLNTYLK